MPDENESWAVGDIGGLARGVAKRRYGFGSEDNRLGVLPFLWSGEHPAGVDPVEAPALPATAPEMIATPIHRHMCADVNGWPKPGQDAGDGGRRGGKGDKEDEREKAERFHGGCPAFRGGLL